MNLLGRDCGRAIGSFLESLKTREPLPTSSKATKSKGLEVSHYCQPRGREVPGCGTLEPLIGPKRAMSAPVKVEPARYWLLSHYRGLRGLDSPIRPSSSNPHNRCIWPWICELGPWSPHSQISMMPEGCLYFWFSGCAHGRLNDNLHVQCKGPVL